MQQDSAFERQSPHIDRLPVEVFHKILAAVGDIFARTFSDDLMIDGTQKIWYSDITNLLLVSKYWNHVSRNTPELWTCLPTHDPEAMDVFVQRSGTRPLHIFLSTSTDDEGPAALAAEKQRQLLQLVPRARGFYWQQGILEDIPEVDEEAEPTEPFSLNVAQVFEILSTTTAPLLRELEIDSGNPDEKPVLPVLFSGTPPPSLRSLLIRNRNIAASNPLLRAPLTSLSLIQVYDVWQDSGEMAQTFSLLGGLEEITLQSSLGLSTLSSTSSGASSPVVSLPNLREFDVNDNMSSIETMFLHLELPISCRISIEARGSSGGSAATKTAALEVFLEALNTHYADAVAAGMAFRVARPLLREVKDDKFLLTAGHLCTAADSPFSPRTVDRADAGAVLEHLFKNTQLVLGMRWDLPDPPATSAAQAVFAHMPVLRGLHALSVSTLDAEPPAAQRRVPNFDVLLARQAGELRWLELTHHPLERLLALGAERAFALFARLETLSIKNAAFTPVPARRGAAQAPAPLDVGRLHWLLTKLARSGRLQKVFIQKCTIDDHEIVSYLRSAVRRDEFEWDHKILGWS